MRQGPFAQKTSHFFSVSAKGATGVDTIREGATGLAPFNQLDRGRALACRLQLDGVAANRRVSSRREVSKTNSVHDKPGLVPRGVGSVAPELRIEEGKSAGSRRTGSGATGRRERGSRVESRQAGLPARRQRTNRACRPGHREHWLPSYEAVLELLLRQ